MLRALYLEYNRSVAVISRENNNQQQFEVEELKCLRCLL